MLARIRAAARKDDGASAVEYGLLVAAIAALIVVVVFALGSLVQDVFDDTCTDHRRQHHERADSSLLML